mgnify:CR=1 FL=1
MGVTLQPDGLQVPSWHGSAGTQDSPEALRLRVTSPGGTTEAATKHLDAAGVKISISEAVRRAEARARELGRT